MLTCKQYVAQSSDYLDGQLTFRQRLVARHHLLFCPNCRRFTRQMRVLGATVKALEEPLPGDVEVMVEWMMRERRK
ncbi:zf-HC2 domain-containing protein [Pseudomonas saxonica]|uniref:Zf-HC2 domain-containing protein n=1 Tax=Pseudomonas saxonica TaxID=2600598 RepID=A0A5C5Q4N9_9PSED|nr:zf-HC2 domain-containing protein [Pseudomonas saxonica]TWS00732.1 zf-HC2 domain-containing protein [Pseudomonas saxonica]WRQ75433.1 zf-HC2 domain-containing protein [Pseudomonas saxonica]